MQSRKTPASADYLMDRLGCSQATLYRLVSELRDSYNAPIINDNGFYYDPTAQFSLPGVRLNMNETNGLLMAAHILDDLQSEALNQPLSRIIQNIEKVLADKGLHNRKLVKIVPALSRKPDPVVFNTLMDALQSEKKVQLAYQGRHDQQNTTRLVSPQRFTHYKNAWYLDAYCHLREDIRLFALEQIQSCEIDIEKSQHIDEQELLSHYATSYGIFSGKATQQAQIQFDLTQAPWVQFEHWHSDQTLEIKGDQTCVLTLPYNEDRELIADVMRFGPAAQIIAPEPLKKAFKTTLKNTLSKYT